MGINVAHKDSKKVYGSPRIHAELNEKGNSWSRHRVARLITREWSRLQTQEEIRVTTNSNHSYSIAENLLQRQFDVSRPGECWVSDITYVPTMEESFESVCDSIPWKADRPFDWN